MFLRGKLNIILNSCFVVFIGGKTSLQSSSQCAEIPIWMKNARIVGGQDAPSPIPW